MAVTLHAALWTDSWGILSGTTKDSLSSASGSWIVTGSFFPDSVLTADGVSYSSLISQLAKAMTGASGSLAGYTGSFDNVSLRYTLSCSVGFTASFTERAQRAFGFPANFQGNVLVSSTRPYFVYRANEANLSRESNAYEPEPIDRIAVSDDGIQVALGRVSSSVYYDWQLMNEPREHVFVSGSLPFSWEDFVKHARCIRPFLLFTGSNILASASLSIGLYKLRAEGSTFRVEPTFPNYDGAWNIDVQARKVTFREGA